MALYFCHVENAGAFYEDTTGFDAADDAEALNVARAIAALLLLGDPTLGFAILTVQSGCGPVVFHASISGLLSEPQ